MTLRTGELLQGRYRISRLVGEGGMAQVFLAHAVTLGNLAVAVKRMRVEASERACLPDLIDQFRTEAALLAHLSHPGLARVYDCFEEADNHYLVMEYIDGKTLLQYVNEGVPPFGTVLTLMSQLCEVIAYLHAQAPPVLFRDLKPGNVMLDPLGRARLIDFGLSRVFGPDIRTRVSLLGAGTAGYSSPEQILGSGTDTRSDIYSLGATIYSVLTRVVPPHAMLLKGGREQLQPASSINPEVPRAMDDLLRRMMSPEAEARPASAEDVLERLREVAGAGRRVEEHAAMRLEVLGGSQAGQSISLPARSVHLGRHDPATASDDRVQIDEPTMSRRQARLTWLPAQRTHLLEHCAGARNSTLVNDTVILSHILRAGDEVRIGALTMRVVVESGEGPTTDTTEPWTDDDAFYLRVVEGAEADRGRRLAVSEAVVVGARHLSLGGPLGRHNDISLADSGVAPAQARLEGVDGVLHLVAEAARFPILLNEAPVESSVPLRTGDHVRIGDTVLVVQAAQALLEMVEWPAHEAHAPVVLGDHGCTIGRVPTCDLVVPDASVSREHARIRRDGRSYVLVKQSRRNPVLVNERTVEGEHVLAHGDAIRLSPMTLLRFVRR